MNVSTIPFKPLLDLAGNESLRELLWRNINTSNFPFPFFFAKKVNEGSDNSEIWCVEQLSIAEKKRYRIAFLSEQPFMEQISSQYYIGVARKIITVYHESWGITSGISFP